MAKINKEKMKALLDETRLEIISLISACPACVKNISHEVGISESAISQHLKILREAGFVRAEKIGYFSHYSADHNELQKFLSQFKDYLLNNKKRSHKCARNPAAEKK